MFLESMRMQTTDHANPHDSSIREMSWLISIIISSLKVSENRMHNNLDKTLTTNQHRQAAERQKKDSNYAQLGKWWEP